MAKLILIKHSLPHIVPEQPSALWQLGEEGVQLCAWLADALRPFALDALASSKQAKALQTAIYLRDALALPLQAYDGLEENDRTDFPFLPLEQFRQRLHDFLQQPDAVLIGKESAAQARARFAAAIAQCWDNSQNVAVVAHGTVNTLFTALHNPTIDVYDLWLRLTCPSFIVLEGEALQWDGQVYKSS